MLSSTGANAGMFTSLTKQLQQLRTDTQALDKAQAACVNKAKDLITARNVAWDNARKSFRAFAFALQVLCDQAPDITQAKALAVAAGLGTKTVAAQQKDSFFGKVLGNGAVHLFAKAVGKRGVRAFYEWQMSVDGGKSWVSLGHTNNAHLLVPSLTLLTRVSFRQSSTVKNVTSAWSQVIELAIL